MAHGPERRTQLRGLYVYKRLTMEAACAAMHLPKSTGNRWKADAKQRGDDWDQSRAALSLGDENFSVMARTLLEHYLQQHQATIDMLVKDASMTPKDRAPLLAMLADSLNKTMASLKRVSPELNQHSIAEDVLAKLTRFAQRHFPKNAPALLEMLEPFAAELAKTYH